MFIAVGQFAAIFWFLSRGGVEVYFVDGAHNRGPIANPVVLPTM